MFWPILPRPAHARTRYSKVRPRWICDAKMYFQRLPSRDEQQSVEKIVPGYSGHSPASHHCREERGVCCHVHVNVRHIKSDTKSGEKARKCLFLLRSHQTEFKKGLTSLLCDLWARSVDVQHNWTPHVQHNSFVREPIAPSARG